MRVNRNYGISTKLAIENLENNACVPGEEPVVVVTPIEGGADSLEAELVEVNSDVVDLQQDADETEAAADVVDEQEELAVTLESIAANGGLDRNGARVLALYSKSLNLRLDLPGHHGVLSTESFGGTADKVTTTKLAAEAIADKAKELWAKIVELFRSAVQAITAMWNRLFDGATKMKAKAENLGKMAAETKAEPASKTFENQKLAENLAIGGQVDAKRAADAVAREAAELPGLSKANVGFAEAVLKALEQGGDVNAVVQAAATLGTQASAQFSKVADAASVGQAAPGEGLELLKSPELPGNRAIIAIVPSEGAKPASLGKVGYKLGMFDASKKVAEKAQLTTLSTGDIQAIAKTIGTAADALLAYKSAQKEAEAIAKKVIAAAEKKAKAAEAEGGEGALAGSDARAIAKGAMASVVNSVPPLAAFALNAGGYVLQYGEQSLKQYKAPAKAEAPAAAAPAQA